MYIEGDVPTMLGNGNNGNNGNGWGNDAWVLIILFALIFGFGNNGWGNNGNNGGGAGGFIGGYDLGSIATKGDISSGFASSATLNGLNDIKLGQAGIQQSLCQGFAGVTGAITNSGYETRSAVTNLGYNLQNCCCELGRQIDGVNYNMATNTCNITNAINSSTRDIIDGQRASTDAILGFLTNEKISSLQTELVQAQNLLAQSNQTNTIINTLRPVAQPAYITCNPFASSYSNNCGCGCGCTM